MMESSWLNFEEIESNTNIASRDEEVREVFALMESNSV